MTNSMVKVVLPHWCMYVSFMIISYLNMLYTGGLGGEMLEEARLIDWIDLLVILLANLTAWSLLLLLYRFITKFRVNLGFVLDVNKNRLAILFLLMLVFNILFTYETGAQVLFREQGELSFLGALINPFYIFPLFYIACRGRINSYIFVLCVLLYSVSELQKGWTGFFILIFSFEIYFMAIKLKTNRGILIFTLILPFIVFVVGGFAYYLVYPIKQSIRYQGDFEQITLAESFNNLTSRLTYFPVAIAAYQRAPEVVSVYESGNMILKESMGLFKPIIPSFLMGDKNFQSLNSDVKVPYFGLDATTSADMGIVSYLYVIFYASPIDGVFLVIITFAFLFVLKFTYDIMAEYRGQFDFLMYLILTSIFYTFSPEHVFSRNFLGIFYMMPFLILFGVVNMRRC